MFVAIKYIHNAPLSSSTLLIYDSKYIFGIYELNAKPFLKYIHNAPSV